MSEKNITKDKNTFAFGKINFILLLVGLAIIVLGYMLMLGGGSEDPNVFNPEIFSFTRITLSPIVLLVGYGFILYAILKKHSAAE